MDKTLAEILGESGLPEEMLASLQEAFDKKVALVRENAEVEIRKEFADRYTHDKDTLVEAMDQMLTDVVKKHEDQKSAEIAKLKESQKKLVSAIKEARSFYKAKLAEHVDATNVFITSQLGRNVKQLVEAKRDYARKTAKADASFAKLKESMLSEQSSRLKKIDEFVVRQMSRELGEFSEDHRALNEARAKLVRENATKLKETQKRFVSESAKKVEDMANSLLSREMKQLHEDLERNRQNSFGRRIFEAVASEFMTSYLAEGTEVRKLQKVLESKNAELEAAKTKIDESSKLIDNAQRKAKLAEANALRSKTMSDLLANLRGEKKSLMESMLETTKTENLRSAFDRLLPVVLSEGARKVPVEKKVLSEKQTRIVTGDKAVRLVETQNDEDVEFDAEIGTIVRLAGISK